MKFDDSAEFLRFLDELIENGLKGPGFCHVLLQLWGHCFLSHYPIPYTVSYSEPWLLQI